MRVSDFSERNAQVGFRAHTIVHATTAADYERDFGRGKVRLVDCRSELGTAEFLTADIEKHHVPAKPPQQLVALAPDFRVARFVRDFRDRKVAEPPKPLGVLGDAVGEVFLLDFPHAKYGRFFHYSPHTNVQTVVIIVTTSAPI